MKNLYVIGNGFDIYHGLDTQYQSFARYLSKHHNEIYELILIYYYLPDISKGEISNDDWNLWSTFELALADLDYEQVLEDKSDYAANPGSPDFKDSEWHAYQIEMEILIDKVTKKLISAFSSFILNVKFPNSISDIQIKIKPESVFLNFNYTDTIERYYNVGAKDICYIHNKVKAYESKIILGHGTDPENFIEDEEVPPVGLTGEELERWEEYMSDQFDLSYENAKSEILSYYTTAFKNTEIVIDQNIKFFDGLRVIENIYVLGHSISEVDIKYFEKIISSTKLDPQWNVSYHREEEKDKYVQTLINLGIDKNKINLIRISDLRTRPSRKTIHLF